MNLGCAFYIICLLFSENCWVLLFYLILYQWIYVLRYFVILHWDSKCTTGYFALTSIYMENYKFKSWFQKIVLSYNFVFYRQNKTPKSPYSFLTYLCTYKRWNFLSKIYDLWYFLRKIVNKQKHELCNISSLGLTIIKNHSNPCSLLIVFPLSIICK